MRGDNKLANNKNNKMAILQLRKKKDKDKENGSGTQDPVAQPAAIGHQGLNEEQLQQIAAVVASATSSGIKNAPFNAPIEEPDVAPFTLADRNIEKLNETLGEETTEALLAMVAQVSSQSASDAGLVLQAMQHQQSDTSAAFKRLEEKMTSMSSVDPEREWITRGYNIFNEHPDETLDYLEKTEKSAGPLLGSDLVAQFEKAQEEQNYDFLDKLRVGVNAHLKGSEKDHAGFNQSGGVSLSKSDKQKMQEEDDKYDADRKAALSHADPKERLSAVLKIGQA